MNKLKNILKSQKLFITILTLFVLVMVLFGNYHVYVKPSVEVQLCHQEAVSMLLETFEQEGAFDGSMQLPLNSEASTEELQRYKLYYDTAFDFCIHSSGYVN